MRGIDDAVDAVEEPDFSEDLLSGDDVDEDDAGIDTGDRVGKNRADAQPYRHALRNRIERATGAKMIALRHATRDDRSALGDQRVGVDIGAGGEGKGIPTTRSALASVCGQRLQKVDPENVQDLTGFRIACARTGDERIFDRGRGARNAGQGANA